MNFAHAALSAVLALTPVTAFAADYPAPIVITEEDIALALAGGLVTKAIYLENPDLALPVATRPDQPLETTLRPGADPVDEARVFGRPMLVVRLGARTFSPEELAYVTISVDGGKTFSPPQMITTDTNALIGSACNTIPGGVVVDDRTQTAYALWLSGNDVESNGQTGCNYSQIGPFNKAWVSTGVPSAVPGIYTWTSHLAWVGDIDVVHKTGDNADKIFATIALDQKGQVHVVLPVRHKDDPLGFVLDCESDPNCKEHPQQTDLLLVTSPDGGAHWTPPVTIDGRSGSHFFPWAAAGSAGRVAVVEYRSSTLRPNDPASVHRAMFRCRSRGARSISVAWARLTNAPTAGFAPSLA